MPILLPPKKAPEEISVTSQKIILFISELAKVNMGCPKSFSVKGGMGAALLDKPEVGRFNVEACDFFAIIKMI